MQRLLLRTLLFIACLLAGAGPMDAWAQHLVQGTVSDQAEGYPLPGVNVSVKGTTIGTATDEEGRYELNVPSPQETLIFSYVGYLPREVEIDGRSRIDVALEVDVAELSEIVVTALDLERSKEELGYSTQKVDGADLVQAREPNVVSSLSGRLAGVNVVSGGSGVGSSSRIVIRGETSLAGDNQPLFVIDGIPVDNGINTVAAEGNMEVDFGNGAADINPDDIESVTVLKGPNAAALYGSRAANGVILITTKSGRGRRGLGVTFNSVTTFETPLRLPQYQNEFGQGSNFQFSFVDGAGGGLNDGVDESWGPRLDAGLCIPQHDSPVNENGERECTPWVSHPDNVRDFFETGLTLSNNLAIAGASDRGNFRLSYTNLDATGTLPNTDLRRHNVSLRAGYDVTERLNIEATANYVRSASDNRPNNSYGTENVMYLWVWFGRQIDMNSLRDYWQPGKEGVQQFNYNYNWHDNPYFTMYENTNGFTKDRLFGNVKATVDLTDKLSLMLRASTDYFDELREYRRAFSTQRFPFGQYREDEINFQETNLDFLLTYDDVIDETWTVSASFGGNQMRQRDDYLRLAANQLSVPGIYNFANARIPLQSFQWNTRKRINSLYGLAQVGYRNMVFLDVTGRNDWSSTLPEDNNAYFYPSVSLSAVMTDLLGLKRPVLGLNYAKLRASWAQVGNDTEPYRLRNVFAFMTPWGSTQMITESNTIANAELKPESVNTYELGAELRFLQDRLRLDASYYDIRSKNQILEIPISTASGYTRKFINAGEIQSRGVELVAGLTPIRSRSGFRWDLDVNWDRNRGKVVELAEGLETYQIASNYVSVEARVGERMGNMYGTDLKRVEDPNSPYHGQIIWENGFPVRDSEIKLLGNYNPDWTAGISNTFTYRNVRLGVLFDIRYGGEILSRTKLIGSTSGMLEETVRGRGPEFGGIEFVDSNGELRQDGIIGEGVRWDEASQSYVPNDVPISARDYFWSLYNRNNEAMGIYDASYVKLREVTLSYRVPRRFVQQLGAQGATLALVGRNLLLWTENPHFDPDVFSFSGGQIVPGVEDMATPSSRSIGFNLQLEF